MPGPSGYEGYGTGGTHNAVVTALAGSYDNDKKALYVNNRPDKTISVSLYTAAGDPVTFSFDGSGFLQVVNPPPVPPAGTTGLNQVIDIDSNAIQNDVYTIPSGETVTLQAVEFTCESGMKMELFEDADGTGASLTTLHKAFVTGDFGLLNIADQITGDGSKAIRLRLTPTTAGGPREMFGRWVGYY
jgi:hypothetical protein